MLLKFTVKVTALNKAGICDGNNLEIINYSDSEKRGLFIEVRCLII